MAEPLLDIEVDADEVLRALEAAGDLAEEACDEAAEETALAVQRETRARVRRRTGQFAASVTVEKAEGPLGGYRVRYAPISGRPKEFALWQEEGTWKMAGNPALGVSAAIEETHHLRRVIDALNRMADQTGLGS